MVLISRSFVQKFSIIFMALIMLVGGFTLNSPGVSAHEGEHSSIRGFECSL